jgi:hypothetical protein
MALHRGNGNIPAPMLNRKLLRGAIGAATVLVAGQAFADTGAELLVKPWPKEQLVEGRVAAQLFADGNSGNEPFDFQLYQYEAQGRVRLLPGERADPRFGFDLLHMEIDSDDPALPDHLTDTAVAAGVGLFENGGWRGGIVLGAGHASASPFDDGNATYAMATLAAATNFSNGDELGIVLDYDGNRSVYPDVPLIGFAYRRELNDDLLLAIGFPFSSLEWKPTDQLKIGIRYKFPEDAELAVDYQVTEQVALFGQLRSRVEAFWWDQLPRGDDRVLFEQRWVEAGARWTPAEQVTLSLSAGYAFGQRFRFGFDSRDNNELADVSDEPFVRAAIEARW